MSGNFCFFTFASSGTNKKHGIKLVIKVKVTLVQDSSFSRLNGLVGWILAPFQFINLHVSQQIAFIYHYVGRTKCGLGLKVGKAIPFLIPDHHVCHPATTIRKAMFGSYPYISIHGNGEIYHAQNGDPSASSANLIFRIQTPRPYGPYPFPISDETGKRSRSMPDADEDHLAAYCIEALKNAGVAKVWGITISGMWIFYQQIWRCAIFRQPLFGEWDLEGLPPHVWLKSDFWFGKYCNLPRYPLGRAGAGSKEVISPGKKKCDKHR